VLQLRPGSAPFEDLLHALHHVAHEMVSPLILRARLIIRHPPNLKRLLRGPSAHGRSI
jgi:hypothetical protein